MAPDVAPPPAVPLLGSRGAASSRRVVAALLLHASLPELRHHPWRYLAAWLAVALGVALAFSVHLINESALGEFSAAVRQVNAQPDFELRGQRGGFDEALYERVAAHPSVALASPVVEVETYVVDPAGKRTALRVLGVDSLVVPTLAPALLGRPFDGAPRLAWLETDSIFLNEAALRGLGLASGSRRADDRAARVRLQSGSRVVELVVRGEVPVDGPPLAVMDIAGAQAAFDRVGRLSRIDVRLVPGAEASRVVNELSLPPGVRTGAPDEASQQVSNLSRAYRVNLTVLALVALFTGAFLVFSVMALSVAKRLPQLALIGVLGSSARERLGLILAESLVLGLFGSLAGIALGTGLAQLALQLLGGDLGGAYFPGVRPVLQFGAGAALAYGALGVVAALAGGWFPARAAQHIAPAQALKGLDASSSPAPPPPGAPALERWAHAGRIWAGPALLVAGALLAAAPPIAGLPLAAYAAVACLLLGGIACVPQVVALLLRGLRPSRRPLALLAVERARHQRHSATIAVAGVVASLSLAAALTVMVGSFRGSIIEWLDSVLPADLYARSATGSAAADAVFLERDLVEQAATLPGVERLEASRLAQVVLDPARPPTVLIARPLPDPARQLPLVGPLLAEPGGTDASAPTPASPAVPVYVSEAIVRLYGFAPGARFDLPLPDGRTAPVWVRGVWRDYARQHGAIAVDESAFRRLTSDARVNDLAFWLSPGTDPATVQGAIRRLAPDSVLDFATPGEIRAVSLRIFDRSFAVTYWLQAIAIGIGLFGIAASFSAQVLARRKEFGLLRHLGLTRREVLTVVAAEGAAWSAAGAVLGLLLGLAVSVVLVHVVNPQSFNWTMQLQPPWGRLALLCVAVVVAGTLTAWWAGRAAARRDLALAVKEDW